MKANLGDSQENCLAVIAHLQHHESLIANCSGTGSVHNLGWRHYAP